MPVAYRIRNARPAVPPVSKPVWPNSTTPKATSSVPVTSACTSS